MKLYAIGNISPA